MSLVQYAANIEAWFLTIRQRGEVKRLVQEVPILAASIRESFAKGHHMEAAHSLKLQELQGLLMKLTDRSRVRLEAALGRYCKTLGFSPEHVQIVFKITEPGWIRRVLALPVSQRLRFMIAETDDAQKYVVKR